MPRKGPARSSKRGVAGWGGGGEEGPKQLNKMSDFWLTWSERGLVGTVGKPTKSRWSRDQKKNGYSSGEVVRPETHIKRQATRQDCLPSLLGNGDKWIDIVYGEEKNLLYWSDWSNQGSTKISCTGSTSPTNQPREDPLHLYSVSPHLPPVSRQGPPLSCFSGFDDVYSCLRILSKQDVWPLHKTICLAVW